MSRLKKKAYIPLDETPEIGEEIYVDEVGLNLDQLSNPGSRDGAVIVDTVHDEVYEGPGTHEELLKEIYEKDYSDEEWNQLNYSLAFGSYLNNFLGAPSIIFYDLSRVGPEKVISIVQKQMPGVVIYEEKAVPGGDEYIERLAGRLKRNTIKG